MSYSLNSSSNDPRVEELRRQHQQRQTRLLVTIALLEGLALVLAAVAIYALGLVPADQGLWILIGIAVIGGFVMSTSLMTMTRRNAREMHDLTGR